MKTRHLAACSGFVGALAAAFVIVPEYVRVRSLVAASHGINSVTPLYDEWILTAFSLGAALVLGGLLSLAVGAMPLGWTRAAVFMAFFVTAPFLGSWPVYAYVYGGEPRGTHINIAGAYRIGPILAVIASFAFTLGYRLFEKRSATDGRRHPSEA